MEVEVGGLETFLSVKVLWTLRNSWHSSKICLKFIQQNVTPLIALRKISNWWMFSWKKETKTKNFELAKLYKLCGFQEASKHFYFLLFLYPWSFNIYQNNKHEKIRHIRLAEDECIFHVMLRLLLLQIVQVLPKFCLSWLSVVHFSFKLVSSNNTISCAIWCK